MQKWLLSMLEEFEQRCTSVRRELTAFHRHSALHNSIIITLYSVLLHSRCFQGHSRCLQKLAVHYKALEFSMVTLLRALCCYSIARAGCSISKNPSHCFFRMHNTDDQPAQSQSPLSIHGCAYKALLHVCKNGHYYL